MIYLKINFRLILKYFWAFYILFNTSTNSFSQFHNQIDDVKTAEDVNKIVYKTIGNVGYDVIEKITFEDKTCQRIADSLKIKSWVKKDFDNNGYTDLLAITSNSDNRKFSDVFCILDSGKGKFYFKYMTINPHDCQLLSVSPKSNLINYYRIIWIPPFINKQYSLQKKQLIYKFDTFIEYNEQPKNNNIQTIEYIRMHGHSTSPSFKLNINADKSMLYESIMYNKKEAGLYFGKIDNKKYQLLIDCLNYMNFPYLENEYSIGWVDTDGSVLKITYNNGKIKTITDNTMTGTFGLTYINNLLLDLAQNHNW